MTATEHSPYVIRNMTRLGSGTCVVIAFSGAYLCYRNANGTDAVRIALALLTLALYGFLAYKIYRYSKTSAYWTSALTAISGLYSFFRLGKWSVWSIAIPIMFLQIARAIPPHYQEPSVIVIPDTAIRNFGQFNWKRVLIAVAASIIFLYFFTQR